MACCILGVLLIGQALAFWRWLGSHGGKLLVGAVSISGVTLLAVGVVDMAGGSSRAPDTGSSDICFGTPVVERIQVLISPTDL